MAAVLFCDDDDDDDCDNVLLSLLPVFILGLFKCRLLEAFCLIVSLVFDDLESEEVLGGDDDGVASSAASSGISVRFCMFLSDDNAVVTVGRQGDRDGCLSVIDVSSDLLLTLLWVSDDGDCRSVMAFKSPALEEPIFLSD